MHNLRNNKKFNDNKGSTNMLNYLSKDKDARYRHNTTSAYETIMIKNNNI